MKLPPVYIIITTYDPGTGVRFEMLKRTIEAMRDKLKYPELRWIISDDGSENFPHEWLDHALNGYDKTFFNVERLGVGKSKNHSLHHAFDRSPVVLLAEDDWELKEPMDLVPHVVTLMEHEDAGMIRLGYLGGEMDATYTSYGNASYWRLHHRSGHYVYSGQISLRHQRFYTALGYHIESVAAGQEEEEMCHRYNDATHVPAILWPAQYGTILNSGPFLNIGLEHSMNAVGVGS